MSQPPSISPSVPGNWFGRNVKWLVPVLILGFLAVIFGVFATIIGVMKSSDAYQLAVARAKKSPAVVEALGTPLREGFFVYGNIHVTTTAGQAQLEIPLHGPKGAATLYVDAQKSAGAWRFAHLVAQVKNSGQRIDLGDAKP